MPGGPGGASGQHPWLAGEVAERQRLGAREPVVDRKHRRDRLAHQVLRSQVVDERRAAQTRVERALAQALDERSDRQLLGAQLDIGDAV
jgi:hypothetical protein